MVGVGALVGTSYGSRNFEIQNSSLAAMLAGWHRTGWPVSSTFERKIEGQELRVDAVKASRGQPARVRSVRVRKRERAVKWLMSRTKEK